MSEPDPETHAKFRLSVPINPHESDLLKLELDYRRVKLRLVWSDAERDDLSDLLSHAQTLIDRGHLEYEVSREAHEIDQDLSALFPDANEEVEDGE